MQSSNTSIKSHQEVKVPSPCDDEEEEDPHINCCCSCCPPIRGAPPTLDQEEIDSGKSCKAHVIYILKWMVFLPAFPFIIIFSYTIPPCNKPDNKKWFLISFITSVIWIAALSFGMVVVVQRIGCLIGVEPFVMSLVVLAAGTSIPDLLSSIIVAREGYGDMAVSNAIGSNVFDILVGMGFPFLLRIIITLGRPFDMMNQFERAAYCTETMVLMPHVKFGFILLGILLTCLLLFIISKFHLNKIIATLFIMLYFCFLTYAFIQEFTCNHTGKFNC